jgi:hypothetical protein
MSVLYTKFLKYASVFSVKYFTCSHFQIKGESRGRFLYKLPINLLLTNKIPGTHAAIFTTIDAEVRKFHILLTYLAHMSS